MNTLVDVSLKKKSIFMVIAKKLQLSNYFKGQSFKNLLSEQKSLLQKLHKIEKDYKSLKKLFFCSLNTFNTLRIRH